jgi:hypothetical protein
MRRRKKGEAVLQKSVPVEIRVICGKKLIRIGYFAAVTFALPRNVAFSSTTSRGASMSPRNVQPDCSSQRSVTKILPSTVPRTLTDFALISPLICACSPMESFPGESIVPSTSPSISNSLRNLTDPLIETPLERRPLGPAGVDVRLGCSETMGGLTGWLAGAVGSLLRLNIDIL